MAFYARFAYVDRTDPAAPSFGGFLEQRYIPACCDLSHRADGQDVPEEPDPEKKPDVFTLSRLHGREYRSAELIFCTDDAAVDRVYVKHPESGAEVSLLRAEPQEGKGPVLYLFPVEIFNEICSSVGDMDVFADTGSNVIVLRLHIFSDDEELYRKMIAELSESSDVLIRTWRSSYVHEKAAEEEANRESVDDGRGGGAGRRYIDTPQDAEHFLSEFEDRVRILQQHAETDLKQVYQKLSIRKAKHITPRTLIEYDSTKSPKVNVLTTEEHFDIYEHRMLRQYLLELQEYIRRRIALSREKVSSLESRREEIRENSSQVEASLRELRLTDRAGDIRRELDASIEKQREAIRKEEEQQESWKAVLYKVSRLPEEIPLLQVRLRGEKRHSSMLFRRNRYYRSIYEMIESFPLTEVYSSINAIPTQKLFTLYERWCYFKIVSLMMEKYGFGIYAFRTEQGVFSEKDRVPDETLPELLRSAVSVSSDQGHSGSYIGLILKQEERDQYIKIEYQRVFGDPDSMERGGKLIPDFSMTFGKRIPSTGGFDISGQLYFLDSKFKKYNKDTMLRELSEVSYGKYIRDIARFTRETISGSYLLHCDNKDTLLAPGESLYEAHEDCIREAYGKAEGLAAASEGHSLDRRAGCFYFVPGEDRYIMRLFRMILEWNSPFGYTDPERCLIWGESRLGIPCRETGKCPVCGTKLSAENILDSLTEGGYAKYHITCPGCGEFWVKSHCRYCHRALIKHTPGHNYLRESRAWYIEPCPHCGR